MSPCTLMIQSGYMENHAQITEEVIHAELCRRPELIDQWIGYSDDQRADNTWYFSRCEDGSYTLSHLKDSKIQTVVSYAKGPEACAVFIKEKLEFIRTVALKIQLKTKGKSR